MADDFVNVSGEAAPTPSAPAAAPAPAAYAPQSATPTAPAAAQPTSGPGEGYVPSYRLRETREQAARESQQAVAAARAEAQSELERVRGQLHALVGVTPQGNPEVDAVRQQFSQLYPGLSKLEDRANDLMGVIDRAGDLEAQNNHYWQVYGRQTMDRLFERFQTTLGSPLTDDGKRSLHSSFVGFVSSSPELTARYANDPTLIDDFVRVFTSNFIDPARRAASATVASRAGQFLPQDIPGGAPMLPGAPKPKDIDERMAQAWTQYQTISKP
jgi:hypothetical protein